MRGNRCAVRREAGAWQNCRDGIAAGWSGRPVVRRGPERGSAILVVLMLMLVVAAIVVANTQTLRHLKGEIRLVDQEQQQKYEPGPGR